MPREPASFEAAWRERFERFASKSDDDAGIAGWSPSGLDARMRRFCGLWTRCEAGERWLDAGCGAGTYTRFLITQGAKVVAVDYSLPTIHKAHARDSGDSAYAVADVRQLPFTPHSFDGVLCFGVMQALSDVTPALHELAAQAAPGARVWVDALNLWCGVHAWEVLRRKLAGRPPHLRYQAPWTIRRGMAAAGLVNAKIYWMPIVPRRWQRFQRALEAPAAQAVFEHLPFAGLLVCHAFIVCAEKPAGCNGVPRGCGTAAGA